MTVFTRTEIPAPTLVCFTPIARMFGQTTWLYVGDPGMQLVRLDVDAKAVTVGPLHVPDGVAYTADSVRAMGQNRLLVHDVNVAGPGSFTVLECDDDTLAITQTDSFAWPDIGYDATRRAFLGLERNASIVTVVQLPGAERIAREWVQTVEALPLRHTAWIPHESIGLQEGSTSGTLAYTSLYDNYQLPDGTTTSDAQELGASVWCSDNLGNESLAANQARFNDAGLELPPDFDMLPWTCQAGSTVSRYQVWGNSVRDHSDGRPATRDVWELSPTPPPRWHETRLNNGVFNGWTDSVEAVQSWDGEDANAGFAHAIGGAYFALGLQADTPPGPTEALRVHTEFAPNPVPVPFPDKAQPVPGGPHRLAFFHDDDPATFYAHSDWQTTDPLLRSLTADTTAVSAGTVVHVGDPARANQRATPLGVSRWSNPATGTTDPAIVQIDYFDPDDGVWTGRHYTYDPFGSPQYVTAYAGGAPEDYGVVVMPNAWLTVLDGPFANSQGLGRRMGLYAPVDAPPATPARVRTPGRLTGRSDGLGPLGGPRRLDTTSASQQSGFHPGPAGSYY